MEPSEEKTIKPRARVLAGLTALGVLSTAWAVFLWTELVSTRTGGTAFCSTGEGTNCVAVWDSAFASLVHARTGLPIAAWGVVWSLTAAVLPLAALRSSKTAPISIGAMKLTSAAGLLSVVIFAAVSLQLGQVCVGCMATYGLVIAYGALTLVAFRKERPSTWTSAMVRVIGLTVGAYVLLLYPGLQTPRSAESATKQAFGTEATGREGVDPAAELKELLARVPAQYRQVMADALRDFEMGLEYSQPPRALQGSPKAPVILTDFTDTLCGHCRKLHESLAELRTRAPKSSFAIDSRQFPLSGQCNPLLESNNPEPSVRCIASKILLCLESNPRIFELQAEIFAEQKGILTEERTWELATRYADRSSIEACLADPATEKKLLDDIEYARKHDIVGTPLVLINGRRAAPFPPLLYALILAGGRADHPAFSVLPPPTPPASSPAP